MKIENHATLKSLGRLRDIMTLPKNFNRPPVVNRSRTLGMVWAGRVHQVRTLEVRRSSSHSWRTQLDLWKLPFSIRRGSSTEVAHWLCTHTWRTQFDLSILPFSIWRGSSIPLPLHQYLEGGLCWISQYCHFPSGDDHVAQEVSRPFQSNKVEYEYAQNVQMKWCDV